MLNRHNLSIAKFASKNVRRSGLMSIHISPAQTTATDGSVLASVTTAKMDPESTPEIAGFSGAVTDFAPFLIDAETALKIGKALPRKTRIPILAFAFIGRETEGNGTAEIAVTDLDTARVFRPKKMGQRYPDWEKAIPEERRLAGSITVNAASLIALLQAAKELADSRAPLVRISVYSKPNPPVKDYKGEMAEQPDTKMIRVDAHTAIEPEQRFMGLLCGLRT